MNNIAVIGSGTMGAGIAQVFAQSGFHVVVVDVNTKALDLAQQTIQKSLKIQLDKQLISLQEHHLTINNLSFSKDLNVVNKETDLAIEAITERLTVKQSLFQQLALLTSDKTILASNTSSIPIFKLASATSKPQQVIGMHFMNPVPRMPLVEVIQTKITKPELVQEVVNLIKRLAKIPVVVNDFPGFVSNRILMPMINEAIECLADGVASVDGIDQVMKLGMAHPMGPLQVADLIGLDVCQHILEVLYFELQKEKYKPHPLLIQLVNNNQLGIKTSQGFYNYQDPKNPKPLLF